MGYDLLEDKPSLRMGTKNKTGAKRTLTQEVKLLNKKWSSLVWALVALVLLLSIGNPVQMLTMSFAAIPFVILFATLSVGAAIIYVAALLAIVFLLLGTVGSIVALASLYFIIPAIVIGIMFKRKRAAWNVFAAGTLAFLIESILLLAFAKVAFDFNFAEFLRTQVDASVATLESAIPSGINMDMIDLVIKQMNMMLPVMLIMSALYMGTVTYAISRRLLTAQGADVNRMRPIKHWMLPKSLLWYYLIVIILELVMSGNTDSSFLSIILLNLSPLLQLAFIVQGISFVFFLADFKRWNRAVPVLITIAVIFIPLLYGLVRIIGIIDLAFPLRQVVSRPKQ